jgi:hypothetical protein
MIGTVLEQAEAYHIYPWHRIDPVTQANIRANGLNPFKQSQIFNSGSRPIGCVYATTSQAIITGPAGAVIPSGTKVIASNGAEFNINNPPGSSGLPSTGSYTCNITAPTSPYLPMDKAAELKPRVPGCSVEITLGMVNSAEGIDSISLDMNHTPNGGFLSFMLTGDPYHLRSVQAKAQWQRAAQQWTIGNTGVEWCTKNGFAIVSSRCQAWFLRDIAEAVIATPKEVPCWFNNREDFQYTLTEIRAAYCYRWDNPVNTGGPATNMIEVHAGFSVGGHSYYHDYLSLACVRALIADPAFSEWVDRAIKNMTDRFDGASGWCTSIPGWYTGLDFRACTNWANAFSVLMAHPAYTGRQASGVEGLTGCPPEFIIQQNGTNWNAFGTLVWLYAAMTRLKQIGYGGDAFHTAYEAFVPAFRASVMSGQFGAKPLGWKYCFTP